VLRSAGEIFALLVPAANLSEGLDIVLDQLETGLPEECLGLLELPVTLTRGQYLDLHAAGLSTVAAVWSADPQRLATVLPAGFISALELKRPKPPKPKTPSA